MRALPSAVDIITIYMSYTNKCSIVVERFNRSKNGTLSRIYFDGLQFVGLEPYDFIVPQGEYLLTLTRSPRFSNLYPYNQLHNSQVPLINGVQGHTGVRIHVGNYLSDTQGCLLIGMRVAPSMIQQSVLAYQTLLKRMSDVEIDNKNVFFVIKFINHYD